MQSLSSQQRLNLVNTSQLHAAWYDLIAARRHYRYGMRWKKVGEREYLYHQKNPGQHATSLGPRSETTEKLWLNFETGRTRYQARVSELRSKLEEQARLNKALRINRVPKTVAEIIRRLDEHAVSKDF